MKEQKLIQEMQKAGTNYAKAAMMPTLPAKAVA